MANWYQIGPLLTKFTNAYIGVPPGGDQGPIGFRAGDAITSDFVDNNPFVIGVGFKITSGEWVRYSMPYHYNLIFGMPPFVHGVDVCFIWTVSLEFTIPGAAGPATVTRQLPPVPPVTTPASSALTVYNTAGRVIPYSKGFRRLQGAKIWLAGIEAGAVALVDTAYASWAESFGYPLHPGEDIFVQRIWFDGNKVWDKDDGFLIDGVSFTWTFYSGTETQEPDPNIVLDKGANRTPAFRGQIYIVFVDVPLATFSNRIPSVTTVEIQPTDGNRITVAGVLEDVGVLGEVSLTVTGIDDEADGVVFASGLNPRSILQTYAEQYNYRIIDGDPITITRRGLNDSFAIDLTLTAADFVSRDASDDVVKPERADPSGLPNQIELTYSDIALNYQTGTQYARRPIFPVPAVTAHGVQTVSSEFIITATEALSIAYDMLYRTWARQLTAKFALIPKHANVEEGDVLSVPTSQGAFVMEVVHRTLNPDDSTDIEGRYLLSENGAALSADAGDISSALKKPYVYPGILAWSARDTSLNFISPSDPPGFFISDGMIVAFAPGTAGLPYGSLLPVNNPPMLTIAPPTIPSTISARNTVSLTDVIFFAAGEAICDDAAYWYMAGPNQFGTDIQVSRISKTTHAIDRILLGIATGVGVASFISAAQSMLFLGFSRRYDTSGDSFPPSLIVVDLVNFSADSVNIIPLTGLDMTPAHTSAQMYGLVVAGGYVLMTGITYVVTSSDDSISPNDQRIWRYSIADGTVDSAFLSYALAAGVGADGAGYFMPWTEGGLNDTTHTHGAKVEGASFAISFFDVTDDANVIHIHNGQRPWADDTWFYFLANNGTQTGGSDSTINAPYLARRRLDDAGADGGADLTFFYDNVGFKLDVGCCDATYHYIHGMAFSLGSEPAVPSRGPGCILRVAIDFGYATFYPARQAPPVNDAFAKATPLKLNVAPLKYDNQYATKETGEPDHGANEGGHSLWYTFTPTVSQTYTITILDGYATNFFDATVAIYRGGSLPSLNEVKSATVNDVNNIVTFNGAAGTTYRIAIDGRYDEATLFTTYAPGTIKITGAPTATNDAFADAIAIAVGETKTADNTFASKETGEPDHAGNAGGKSLWWSFTAPDDATYRLTTDDSDIPTVVAAYTGTAVGSLIEIASALDTGGTDDDWTAWSITR